MYLLQRKIDKIMHIQAYIQSSKEEYASKRIITGCSVRIEYSVTWDNRLASLGKSCDAEQLSLWRNIQSAPHNR